VDVDAIVSPDMLVDTMHYSRHGTFLLGQHILAVFEGREQAASGKAGRPKKEDSFRREARVEKALRRQERSTRDGGKGKKKPASDEDRAQRREERKKERAARRIASALAED
jgi:hypothetical protein